MPAKKRPSLVYYSVIFWQRVDFPLPSQYYSPLLQNWSYLLISKIRLWNRLKKNITCIVIFNSDGPVAQQRPGRVQTDNFPKNNKNINPSKYLYACVNLSTMALLGNSLMNNNLIVTYTIIYWMKINFNKIMLLY